MPGCHFKDFSPFYALYRSGFYAKKHRLIMEELPDDEKEELNQKIIAFFVERLDSIRLSWQKAGIDVNLPIWRAILQPSFVRWLFNANNPLQVKGDRAAHPFAKVKIMQSFDYYLEGNKVDVELRSNLEILKNVYPAIAEAVARETAGLGPVQAPPPPLTSTMHWPTPAVASPPPPTPTRRPSCSPRR